LNVCFVTSSWQHKRNRWKKSIERESSKQAIELNSIGLFTMNCFLIALRSTLKFCFISYCKTVQFWTWYGFNSYLISFEIKLLKRWKFWNLILKRETTKGFRTSVNLKKSLARLSFSFKYEIDMYFILR